jgi:hypothetical protein
MSQHRTELTQNFSQYGCSKVGNAHPIYEISEELKLANQ